MPRKTDSSNPADWLFIAQSDLEAIRDLGDRELGYWLCRSRLAEVLEKVLKAELIRLGWFLEKTHDLVKLGQELKSRKSDLMSSVKPLCDVFAQVYFVDRYPGFELDDPDWPRLRAQIEQVSALLVAVKARVPGA